MNESRANGWNPQIGLAHPTAGTAGSGGCSVLAKKGTGIAPAQASTFPDGSQHRLELTHVNAVLKGGLHCLSNYLIDGEGLSPSNMTRLEHAAVALNLCHGPWVMAGDFNIEPGDIARSGFLQMVDGVLFHTNSPTCGNNTRDYFIVHRSLAHAVIGIQRVDGVGLHPHSPVRLILRGDSRRFAVRQLVRPPKVAATLPHGPPVQPPSYASIIANLTRIEPHLSSDASALHHTEVINGATTERFTNIPDEFSNIPGTDLKFKPCRFKWAPAIPQVAKPWVGATALSSTWRGLASRANETARLLTPAPASPFDRPSSHCISRKSRSHIC